VAANFEFGLPANQYTFIPVARLSDYSPTRYAVTASRAVELAGQTAIINHYTVQNNRVVNHGIAPEEVAAVARTEIRRAQVMETRSGNGNALPSERLAKQGGTLIIYHPQLPTPSVQRPPANATPSVRSVRTSLNSAPLAAPAPAGDLVSVKPVALNGTRMPADRADFFPPGSLVMIGNKNAALPPSPSPLPNMKLPHSANVQASSPDSPSPTGASGNTAVAAPAAGFNFNGNAGYSEANNHPNQPRPAIARPASTLGTAVYVIPPRYSVDEGLANRAQGNQGNYNTTGSPAYAQEHQPEAPQSRANYEPRGESRPAEMPHVMPPAPAVPHNEPAPVSHAAAAVAAAAASSSATSSSSSNSGKK
jgi:hypothetical protein